MLTKKEFSNIPVLSAQLITAPTGKPRDILNFAPAEPPRPRTQFALLPHVTTSKHQKI